MLSQDVEDDAGVLTRLLAKAVAGVWELDAWGLTLASMARNFGLSDRFRRRCCILDVY